MANRDNDSSTPEGFQDEEAYLRSLTDSVKQRKSIVVARPPRNMLAKREETPEPAAPMPLVPPPPSARVRTEAKPGAAPHQPAAPAPTAARPASSPANARLADPAAVDGTFPVGAILLFEDQSVAVFKDAKPDKDYEVVYLLRGDGSIKAQGVALSAYDARQIGSLPHEFLADMQQRNNWVRDEIIYHLERFEYCQLIPHPDHSQHDPMATGKLSGIFRKVVAEKKAEGKDLVRGRQLVINFGPTQKWDAVYWGEDELGHVVAHHTHDRWALMHLDLKRFRETLIWGEMAADATVAEIHRDVAG